MRKINKREFQKCTKQLLKDPTLQKIETQSFIFFRVNGNIEVKFKQIKGLTGFFTLGEIQNSETLRAILKTVETELEKRNG